MPKHTKFSLKRLQPQFNPELQKILTRLADDRGDESVQKVVEALQIFSGAIDIRVTTKYSPADCDGVDLMITIFRSKKQMNRFGQLKQKRIQAFLPLQIKSSISGAIKFAANRQNKIPVLVRLPGATNGQIAAAFQKIFNLYEPFEKKHKQGIVEFAGDR